MDSVAGIVIFAIVAVVVLCFLFSPKPSAAMISQTSSVPSLKTIPAYSIGTGNCCQPSTYCGGGGLTMPQVVEGENGLWRFQVYTVQPGAVNSKYLAVQMC